MLAFPLSVHPGDTVTSPGVDTNLFVWTVAWNAHALVHKPGSLFQANTFHPHANSLAFSENLLGSSIFAAPILWLGGGPVLAMNIVALTSIPLSALGAWLLARQLGASGYAAFLGGLVFGFAPPRFFRLDQLHLTTVQWIPFCLAYAHRYLQHGHASDLRIAIAFFTLQALTSGHAAVFLTTALALLILSAVISGIPLRPLQRVKDIGFAGVALLVPVALMLAPYRRVQEEVDLVRSLADYRVVTWQSFFASPSHLHRWLVDTFVPSANIIGAAGAYLFPGILPLLLAAVAILSRNDSRHAGDHGTFDRSQMVATALEFVAVAAVAVGVWASLQAPLRWRIGDVTVLTIRSAGRAWLVALACVGLRIACLGRAPFHPLKTFGDLAARVSHRRSAGKIHAPAFYALLTAICVWLAAAPPFGLWPHVYWLPGFNFIRAPSRFMILGMLGIGTLAAFGFDRLSRGSSLRARTLWTAIVAASMIAEFSAAPLGISRDSGDLPAIDRWLAGSTGPRVIAEAPVNPAVSEHDMQQSQYMRHSMAHWHKTVHGYSGVHPPLTIGLYDHLTRFPEDETIRALKSVGVDTVVVHLDAYPAHVRPAIEQRLTGHPALRLERADGDGRIYAIR